MTDLSIRISAKGQTFESGQRGHFDQCVTDTIPSETRDTGPITIEMCRPYLSPALPLGLLLLAFILVSILSYRLFLKLEKNAYGSLKEFLVTNGVTLSLGDELVDLLASMKEIQIQLDAARRRAIAAAEAESYAKIARQVAHDIRSPLAVLNILTQDAPFEADARGAIDRAVARIKDIAKDLSRAATARTPELAAEDVTNQIAEILSEKRIEYPDYADSLEFTRSGRRGVAARVRVNPPEFRRILSNLLNNAIEASDQPTPITVSLDLEDEALRVSILDQGRGIPADILPRLGKEQLTQGKSHGTGVGLLHASETLESWGAGLRISSEVGKGSEITLEFPTHGAREKI